MSQDPLAMASHQLAGIKEVLLEESNKRAAMHRDWVSARTLLDLAQAVDNLHHRMLSLTNHPSEKGTEESRLTKKRTKNSEQRLSKSAFPKFYIKDGVLIKEGLRRNRRGTYQHVIGKTEFEKTFSILQDIASNHKVFKAESVVERTALPAYQVYLLLALLKRLGSLESLQRGEYRILNGALNTEPNNLWSQLPVQQ